ncbi:MAG TPA: CoA transferase [Vicinamibacterales bacterium]|nr:CoA transferase [Vicinamibacterales bacterium]
MTSTSASPPAPLAGVTVADFSRVLTGPFCTLLLADMGARVIKIEQPGRGDETRSWGPPFVGGESAYFLSVNRNKESLALDLKHPRAAAVVERLLARADVLVENFRPGAAARLGLAYEALAARHPRLVYCSISGFGQTGPRRSEPGYDAVIQAEGGLMAVTGPEEGPGYRLGVAISDLTAGMYAAFGIVLALLARERTGRGQLVDVGMLDATVSLLTYQAGIHFAGGRPRPLGNRHPTIAPYDTFPAADGEIVIAVGNDEQWRRLCAVAGIETLGLDPRFATNPDRVRRYAELRPLLEAVFRRRPRADWIARLRDAGVPCGAVRSVAEALADAQLAAREMIVTLAHPTAGAVRTLGVPVKLSHSPGAVRTAPPRLGEHTDRILAELGFGEPARTELRRAGVVA